MDISRRVAYLKGLAEGLQVSESSNEGKLLLSVLDVLGDIADAIDSLSFDVDTICDEIDIIDEDLDYIISDDFMDLNERHLSGGVPAEYDDFEGELYEVSCPQCKEQILLDEEMLDEGEVICLSCGSSLELDFDDIFDDDEDFVESDN